MDQKFMLEEQGNAYQYIKSNHFAFFLKYVKGVNMTYYDCEGKKLTTLPLTDNMFSIVAQTSDKEFWEDKENDQVAYLSSLIVPVLIELGKIVNYTVHLFVAENCNEGFGHDLMWNNLVTGLDNAPMDYVDEQKKGFACTTPLYMSYSIMMLTKMVLKPLPPVTSAWRSLALIVWSFVTISLFTLIIMEKTTQIMSTKRNKSKSISSLIWIYLKPFLGIGEDLGFRNYLYILWLFSLFPLIEIVKNDLFANMIDRESRTINTLSELLDEDLIPFTDDFKVGYWETNRSHDSFIEGEFKENFLKMRAKLRIIGGDLMGELLELVKDPPALLDWFDDKALLEDENWVNLMSTYLPKFMPVHVGEAYVPKLITPLCYARWTFKFVKETEKLSRRLYETSLLQYWYHLKDRYFFTMYLNIFSADYNITDFYAEDMETMANKGLEITHMKSFFELIGFCFAFCSLIFLIELLLKI